MGLEGRLDVRVPLALLADVDAVGVARGGMSRADLLRWALAEFVALHGHGGPGGRDVMIAEAIGRGYRRSQPEPTEPRTVMPDAVRSTAAGVGLVPASRLVTPLPKGESRRDRA